MLRRVALMLTLLIAIAASATQRGEKSLGLAGGFNTANDGAVAGVFFQYSFYRHFRLAPSADYVFRHRGIDGLHVNLDCHFPIGVGSGRFDVYPLVGLNFMSMYDHSIVETEDVSSRRTRLGLNIGGGCEFYCTSSLKIFAEGKFNWVKDFNSGVFTVGIGYVF